ncbi:unnamed protein product [Symbiodinium natans]|uniref:FAD dependent oxidoreductase domain-containing protein n=1 Tax=Symbiodinium natans TaxID=878477 RepID=A0A812UVU9_9DINO|nr:unnamed protein product [Symbiodinium natans]
MPWLTHHPKLRALKTYACGGDGSSDLEARFVAAGSLRECVDRCLIMTRLDTMQVGLESGLERCALRGSTVAVPAMAARKDDANRSLRLDPEMALNMLAAVMGGLVLLLLLGPQFSLLAVLCCRRSPTPTALPAIVGEEDKGAEGLLRHLMFLLLFMPGVGGCWICVLGGGVLGAAIARAAARRGVATTLLEKSFVGSGVSAGNTGIACTMLGIQKDTEEWRCLTEGRPLNLPTYQSLGIPHRSTGALYVAWSPEEFRALDVLQGQEAKSEMVSPEDLRLRQPKLAAAKGALFVPEEVTVDPGLVVLAYAADAVRHGAAIFEETEAAALVAVGRA